MSPLHAPGAPSPTGARRLFAVWLACLLSACLFRAGVAYAEPQPGPPPPTPVPAAATPGIDPDAEADPEEPSIWSYIESADGAAPAPEVVEATEELVAERIAEIGFSGLVGAEPPVEYYLDPVGVTNRDPLHLDSVDPTEFDIPVVVNDSVRKWMVYFLGPGRKYYARYLERSTRWMPMMRRELDARGLPRDLVYLSMIESGFSTGATSYAAAAGLWQFMTYTGRDYGLRIDWWMDERRDPEAATKAALQYLGDLNKMFAGDWWLSWASYNGGQGKLLAATRRFGTTDFWKIAEGSYLQPETENYVPKIIAAAIIGKHPERYGFVGIKYQPEFTFDTAEAPASTSVAVLARCAQMSEEQFLDYNPALRRFALPPDPPVQKVRVPAGKGAAFAEALAKVPADERLVLQRHVVRRGESLATIAKKYGVTAEEVATLNRIGSRSRLRVGMELVVPVNPKATASVDPEPAPAPAPAPTKASSSPAPAAPVSKGSPAVVHVVRSGDTLGSIAAKYGVSTSQVQSWNKLSGTKILVGQKLIVKPATSGGSSSSSSASASKPTTSGASASSASTPKGKVITYTVRRGDTLSTIADRYNCSVSDIKAWNGLRGSTIYPGQKLKIKG